MSKEEADNFVGDVIVVFRPTAQQLGHLRLAVIVSLAVAVVVGLIAYGSGSSFAVSIAIITGVAMLMFLGFYLAYLPAVTEVGTAGIRGRSLGGRYEYRWEQVDNVLRRAVTSRGSTTYTVVLRTTRGNRKLGAPVNGGIMGDPEFDVKFARIRDTWQAARGLA